MGLPGYTEPGDEVGEAKNPRSNGPIRPASQVGSTLEPLVVDEVCETQPLSVARA